MDRIDIWIPVSRIDYARLSASTNTDECSRDIRARVTAARDRQKNRFHAQGRHIDVNSEMNSQDIESYAHIDDRARATLRSSAERLSISARAFHRVIKVSRTIADLANSEYIHTEHVLEALQYRQCY